MKVITFLLYVASAAAFSTPNAPSSTTRLNAISRRGFFGGAASIAVSTLLQPASASAVDSVLAINGIYSDPNHKNGYRVVRAVDKSTAVVTLQDEPDGPIIVVNGKIATNQKGTTITLDLSPKGGPKDVVATVNGGDLVFPDGNAWSKFSGIDGIYSDPNHPAGYRIVRLGSGGNINITLQDDPSGPVVELIGERKTSGGDLVVDFSPKGGPKDLPVKFENDKLVFPDGNAWPKF